MRSRSSGVTVEHPARPEEQRVASRAPSIASAAISTPSALVRLDYHGLAEAVARRSA